MAVTSSSARLAGVALVSRDIERLAAFYVEAFGFERLSSLHAEPAAGSSGQQHRLSLGLGAQRLDLIAFDEPGAPYPAEVPGWSLAFQHIALIATDMSAIDRLTRRHDWQPISTNGPQRLPPRSGGVTAFKFRDPDGHPLELLAFPPGAAPPAWRGAGASSGQVLGYDHSALSVRDTAVSVAFYARLGLSVTAQTLNHGVEQACLDDVADPRVEVTTLTPGGAPTPHVELLCYRGAYDRTTGSAGLNDVAASRLMLDVDPASWPSEGRTDAGDHAILRDPDWHLLELRRS